MNEMTRVVGRPHTAFTARFSTGEFLRMAELDAFGDAKVELVDGELERMPPPQREHSRLQSSLLAQIVALIGIDRAGGELGIDFGDDTVLGCDAFILRAPLVENRWPVPDELLLVVEVSRTTLGRDLGMKVPRYAAAGIPNCWVVDSMASAIHVFGLPDQGQYGQARVTRFGEPLAVPGTDATITLA